MFELVEFLDVKSCYPKYPDPSKVPILRTRTPAIQVHSPFHWRVQPGILRVTSFLLTIVTLGAVQRRVDASKNWRKVGNDFILFELGKESWQVRAVSFRELPHLEGHPT